MDTKSIIDTITDSLSIGLELYLLYKRISPTYAKIIRIGELDLSKMVEGSMIYSFQQNGNAIMFLLSYKENIVEYIVSILSTLVEIISYSNSRMTREDIRRCVQIGVDNSVSKIAERGEVCSSYESLFRRYPICIKYDEELLKEWRYIFSTRFGA